MLPWIIGGAIIAAGTYMLNESSKENKAERRRYNNEYDKQKKRLEKSYSKAQKRDHMDKLYKMRRAKVKVADNIYREYESQNSHFKEINRAICEINLSLDFQFSQKRTSSIREEKRAIQIEIEQLLDAKKELFVINDRMKVSVRSLRADLKRANSDTRMLKEEINRQGSVSLATYG